MAMAFADTVKAVHDHNPNNTFEIMLHCTSVDGESKLETFSGISPSAVDFVQDNMFEGRPNLEAVFNDVAKQFSGHSIYAGGSDSALVLNGPYLQALAQAHKWGALLCLVFADPLFLLSVLGCHGRVPWRVFSWYTPKTMAMRRCLWSRNPHPYCFGVIFQAQLHLPF